MVEETIMFGNRYRSSFLEVNTESQLKQKYYLEMGVIISEALKIVKLSKNLR